jgi:Transposase DDE domain
VTEARTEHLKEKVEIVRAQMQRLKQLGEQMRQTPDEQISLTDPDARSMATSARGSGVVGYNVQTAVEAKHHLVVTHEVTNQGTDRAQLASIGTQTQAVIGTQKLTALADRGYYKGEEILKCEQAGINALVPKSYTSNNLAKGQFDKRDFRYIAKDDEYQCPAGQRAIWRKAAVVDGQVLHRYWSSACPRCPIKSQCTTNVNRHIVRWEHEAVLEAMQARLERMPDAARIRRQTAEHVFGTLKSWMGATHFLTKRLPNVRTEMSLHVLAYNLKRAMQIFGVVPLIAAIKT